MSVDPPIILQHNQTLQRGLGDADLLNSELLKLREAKQFGKAVGAVALAECSNAEAAGEAGDGRRRWRRLWHLWVQKSVKEINLLEVIEGWGPDPVVDRVGAVVDEVRGNAEAAVEPRWTERMRETAPA